MKLFYTPQRIVEGMVLRLQEREKLVIDSRKCLEDCNLSVPLASVTRMITLLQDVAFGQLPHDA
jgi:hypothetical protein